MIYTHNLTSKILDTIEEILEKHDITIPDKNREGDPDEARIYGSVYNELQEKIEKILVEELKER